MGITLPPRRRRNQPNEPQPPESSVDGKLYCWRFKHPKAGWCGGDPDDRWLANKSEVESAMKYCPYPSELLEKSA